MLGTPLRTEEGEPVAPSNVGFDDGSKLGRSIGLSLGALLGISVRTDEGEPVAPSTVGFDDGSKLGALLGISLGTDEGSLGVGLAVGLGVGIAVGPTEGTLLGTTLEEGELLGKTLEVGAPVTVGVDEGAKLGPPVGAVGKMLTLGADVGCNDGSDDGEDVGPNKMFTMIGAGSSTLSTKACTAGISVKPSTCTGIDEEVSEPEIQKTRPALNMSSFCRRRLSGPENSMSSTLTNPGRLA